MYRRYRARLGHNKAVFAVAHQILLTAYMMLSRSEDYRELSGDYFDRENKPRVAQRLVKRLARLGYSVIPQEPDDPLAEYRFRFPVNRARFLAMITIR